MLYIPRCAAPVEIATILSPRGEGFSEYLPPKLVDQRRIDAHAVASDDDQWIHTDPERARATDYGTTIAQGGLLLGMVPGLLHFTEEIHVEGQTEVRHKGGEYEFKQPVLSGRSVHARWRLWKDKKIVANSKLIGIWFEYQVAIAEDQDILALEGKIRAVFIR